MTLPELFGRRLSRGETSPYGTEFAILEGGEIYASRERAEKRTSDMKG